MTFSTFLKLVEIQTKIASVFPFLVGSLFVYYRYETINLLTTLIFFFSMLLFDLTTTAINNYMDYKKASSEAYRRERNIIGQKHIPEPLVVMTIVTLLTIATGLGLWLVALTDIIVLFIGMVCFAIGIFYTFGPIPLSRMPLGEAFSGGAMGFGIIFLVVYVNAFDQGIAQFIWEGQMITFNANMILLFEIGLISIPSMLTIANLMLANNICDVEEDIANKRFTLPYYLGKKWSLVLFNFLYVVSFLAIVLAVILSVLPPVMLLSLFIIYPVYSLVRQFNRKQVKSETFEVAVKNLVLVNGSSVALLLIAVFI